MSSALATTEEGTGTKAENSFGKRKLILIIVPVVLLAVIGAGLWFSGIIPHLAKNAANNRVSAISESPTLVEVPDIVTNLDNGSHRAVFVRLKARIEVAHVADQVLISNEMPRILDAFQTYLRSMRPEELRGGEGTYRLREALMNRIDVIAAPVQVLDVLFIEMLIQ